LTEIEKNLETLAELEIVVSRGLQTFMEVGMALASIRERKLYREKGYGTFKEYCRAEWGLDDRTARRIMQTSKAVEEMEAVEEKSGPIGPLSPASEGQARPLAKIKDPEERAEVWREVVEEAGAEEKPVTAARVEEKVSRRLGAERRASIGPTEEAGDVDGDVEEPGPDDIVRIVKAGKMEFVVEFGDGKRHMIPRAALLKRGFGKCKTCGFGVVHHHEE
jgi:hypothetical protein